jgi:phage N-6-adenine-methyltransferase
VEGSKLRLRGPKGSLDGALGHRVLDLRDALYAAIAAPRRTHKPTNPQTPRPDSEPAGTADPQTSCFVADGQATETGGGLCDAPPERARCRRAHTALDAKPTPKPSDPAEEPPTKRPATVRPVQASDRYATAPEDFERLDREFHFTLDVCAEPSTAKCVRYFQADDPDDPATYDGLRQEWGTAVCWMNPPYSQPGPWMGKAWGAARTGATVVALVRHDPSTAWWKMWVQQPDGKLVASEVRPLQNRPRFWKNGVPEAHDYNFPCAYVIYRPPDSAG